METIEKIIAYFKEKPGTTAVIGLGGVILFATIEVMPLMYLSVAIALVGYLLYQSQAKQGKRRNKEAQTADEVAKLKATIKKLRADNTSRTQKGKATTKGKNKTK